MNEYANQLLGQCFYNRPLRYDLRNQGGCFKLLSGQTPKRNLWSQQYLPLSPNGGVRFKNKNEKRAQLDEQTIDKDRVNGDRCSYEGEPTLFSNRR